MANGVSKPKSLKSYKKMRAEATKRTNQLYRNKMRSVRSEGISMAEKIERSTGAADKVIDKVKRYKNPGNR